MVKLTVLTLVRIMQTCYLCCQGTCSKEEEIIYLEYLWTFVMQM